MMKNKICTVIGTANEAGLQLAREYASDGYQIALVGLHRDQLDRYRGELERQNTKVEVYHQNYIEAEHFSNMAELFRQIRKDKGSVRALVYNESIYSDSFSGPNTGQNPFQDIRMNCSAAFAAINQVVPRMRKNRYGAIHFTGPEFNQHYRHGQIDSACSMAREMSFNLSMELEYQGLRVWETGQNGPQPTYRDGSYGYQQPFHQNQYGYNGHAPNQRFGNNGSANGQYSSHGMSNGSGYQNNGSGMGNSFRQNGMYHNPGNNWQYDAGGRNYGYGHSDYYPGPEWRNSNYGFNSLRSSNAYGGWGNQPYGPQMNHSYHGHAKNRPWWTDELGFQGFPRNDRSRNSGGYNYQSQPGYSNQQWSHFDSGNPQNMPWWTEEMDVQGSPWNQGFRNSGFPNNYGQPAYSNWPGNYTHHSNAQNKPWWTDEYGFHGFPRNNDSRHSGYHTYQGQPHYSNGQGNYGDNKSSSNSYFGGQYNNHWNTPQTDPQTGWNDAHPWSRQFNFSDSSLYRFNREQGPGMFQPVYSSFNYANGDSQHSNPSGWSGMSGNGYTSERYRNRQNSWTGENRSGYNTTGHSQSNGVAQPEFTQVN